jgi:hypothetical protein
MTRKRDRLSNRAARYQGERRFPRVVPETGLLRILGRIGKPADPKPDVASMPRKPESEQAATAGK